MFARTDTPPSPIMEEKLNIVITKLDDLSSKIQSLERYIMAMTNGRHTSTRTSNAAKQSIASIALAEMPKQYASLFYQSSSTDGPVKKKSSGNCLAIITLGLTCIALIFAIVAVGTNCWLIIKGSCHVGIFGCEGLGCGNFVEGTAVFMIMAICAISCGTFSILWRMVNCSGMLCLRKGAAFSLLVGGTMALIAVIVYGSKHNTLILPEDESESSGLGYSYFLAVVAGFFALVTGVIVCIDASIRVKKRQPVLRSDGYGKFSISKPAKDVEIDEEGSSDMLDANQVTESITKVTDSKTKVEEVEAKSVGSYSRYSLFGY